MKALKSTFFIMLSIIILSACSSVQKHKLNLPPAEKYLFVSDLHPERATNRDMRKFLKAKENEYTIFEDNLVYEE